MTLRNSVWSGWVRALTAPFCVDAYAERKAKRQHFDSRLHVDLEALIRCQVAPESTPRNVTLLPAVATAATPAAEKRDAHHPLVIRSFTLATGLYLYVSSQRLQRLQNREILQLYLLLINSGAEIAENKAHLPHAVPFHTSPPESNLLCVL